VISITIVEAEGQKPALGQQRAEFQTSTEHESLTARQHQAPTGSPNLGNDVVDNSVGAIYLVRITALIFKKKE